MRMRDVIIAREEEGIFPFLFGSARRDLTFGPAPWPSVDLVLDESPHRALDDAVDDEAVLDSFNDQL